jgi:hypothetical protein
MRTAILPAAIGTLLLAGCATATLPGDSVSYLYGNRYYQTKLYTYPTRVTHVDGVSTMFNENPVPIAAGEHVITLSAAPVRGFEQPESRDFKLVVQPCKRYYLVAEREHPLKRDWQPVIDATVDDRSVCKAKA